MERGRRVRAATGQVGATRLVVLGVGCGLLYVGMYAAQRAIHAGPGSNAFAASLALYPVITIGVFGLYAWVLVICRRPLTGAVRLAAWGVPVVYRWVRTPTDLVRGIAVLMVIYTLLPLGRLCRSRLQADPATLSFFQAVTLPPRRGEVAQGGVDQHAGAVEIDAGGRGARARV